MSVNNKRVFYVKYLAHPIYTEILKARPDVRLDRLENESPESEFAPILSAAHAYQVGAARDEIAPHFHVHDDLLEARAEPADRLQQRRGLRPRRCRCLHQKPACSCSTSPAAMRDSVAEHALGMLLTLSKRIIEADRALRRDRDVNRNALIGREAQGSTIGIVGIGNVGRRLAELCKGLLRMKVLAYDPYLSADEIAGAGRREGRARRVAAPLRLCLDQLPAHQGEPRHDRRKAVRADAAARLLHHHRARLHP